MSDGAPSTSGRGAAASGGASSGGLWPHAGSLSLPGYTHLSASTIGQLSTTQLALTIAGAAVTGAVVWHYTRDAYYAYVPPRYQYRPGTITGWMASLLARHAKRRRSRRPVRVYLDGCFDLMHYGHANALRQAKALGDELVVGLVPDREILRCKGPPILKDEERLKLVQSVKWVDEVLTDVPYDLTPEFLHELFTKHRIDYVLHGDDPCLLPDGTDAYAHAKKLGRFKMIKRTEGVSTTDIVGRMLMCSRDNARFAAAEQERLTLEFSLGNGDTDSEGEPGSPAANGAANGDNGDKPRKGSRHVTVSRFMPTSRRIVQFSSGKSAPAGARIVYIDGAFDLFHVGHVEILKKAKQAGDFLLVGVHTDEEVTERRGPHLPIMALHERALSVLSCRYVDEVVIGAPTEITEDLLTTFNISLVVTGSVHETPHRAEGESERYGVPRERGIFKQLESPETMTSAKLIERIVANRALFEERQAKKTKSEAAYYQTSKTYLQEI
ncbi:hypothetical protein ABPG77_003574 [Micractinium sp. CCAP 211/92]